MEKIKKQGSSEILLSIIVIALILAYSISDKHAGLIVFSFIFILAFVLEYYREDGGEPK